MYFRNPVPDNPEWVISFAWCAKDGEDLQKGYEYLKRIRALPGRVSGDDVVETDFATIIRTIPVISVKGITAYQRGVVTTGITSAVARSLCDQWKSDKMYLAVPSHYAHGKAIEPNPGACYPLRFKHRLFPLITVAQSLATDEEVQEAVHRATDDAASDLMATGDALEGVTNGNLMPPRDTDVEATFGKEIVERLRALKRRYDPTDFFSGGYPAL